MTQSFVIQTSLSVGVIHSNTETAIIVITEDKLENAVNKHLESCKSKDKWQAPLGILLSIAIMFLTSEFKDALGVEKSVWKAFFMLLFAGVSVWLIFNLIELKKNWNINASYLITVIKNASEKQSSLEQGAGHQ